VRSLAATLTALVLLAPERQAAACAACSCGDQTLTATGTERPYKNRVRATLEERYGSFDVGATDASEHVDVLRSTLALGWSPTSRLTISALLPWFTNWIRPLGHSQQELNGLGDLEVAARGVVFRERAFAPHHVLSVGGGLKFPTGPRVYDDAHYPVPDDDQPGTGSFDPFVGVTYTYFSGELISAWSSASFRYTTTGPRGYRRGSVFGGTAAIQVQPWSWGAVVLGADVVWQEADTLQNGKASPNSGGTIGYLAPALVFMPVMDLLVKATVDVPVLYGLNGTQSFGPQVSLLLAYDFK
jgi:hypothetical protein